MWIRLLKSCRVSGRSLAAGDLVHVSVDEAADLMRLGLGVIILGDPQIAIRELENDILTGRVRGVGVALTLGKIRILRENLSKIEEEPDGLTLAE